MPELKSQTTSARSVPIGRMPNRCPPLSPLCPVLNSSLFILEEFKWYPEYLLQCVFLLSLLCSLLIQASTLWPALCLGWLRLGFFLRFFPSQISLWGCAFLDSASHLLSPVILCLCKKKKKKRHWVPQPLMPFSVPQFWVPAGSDWAS